MVGTFKLKCLSRALCHMPLWGRCLRSKSWGTEGLRPLTWHHGTSGSVSTRTKCSAPWLSFTLRLRILLTAGERLALACLSLTWTKLSKIKPNINWQNRKSALPNSLYQNAAYSASCGSSKSNHQGCGVAVTLASYGQGRLLRNHPVSFPGISLAWQRNTTFTPLFWQVFCTGPAPPGKGHWPCDGGYWAHMRVTVSCHQATGQVTLHTGGK